MIPVGLDEIRALGLGRLEQADGGAPRAPVTGIRADSREVGPGDLFVALNAGVAYVDEARARGASTLVPDDQDAALAALASLVRSKSSARAVAIVGSAGKTTTKDVLGVLCAPHTPTIWSERSLNNEIGVPLTVCRLEPETAVLVTEMGMRGPGQVAALCEVVRPEVAVVTHIGPEHLELVGTVERVAEANAEAVASLPSGGIAVVPSRARELDRFLERGDVEVHRFDPDDVELDDGRGRFCLDGRQVELELPFTQRHHALNVLAALHAYAALGLPLDHVHEGARDIELSPWRGQELPLPGGGFVVNDAYNANPDSMRAGLQALAWMSRHPERGRRSWAVLGEMAELGHDTISEHDRIGRLVVRLDVSRLVVVGTGRSMRAMHHGAVMEGSWGGEATMVDDADAALALLRAELEPGDVVLVKASNSAGLGALAQSLARATTG